MNFMLSVFAESLLPGTPCYVADFGEPAFRQADAVGVPPNPALQYVPYCGSFYFIYTYLFTLLLNLFV
jgi:hypothetical protein